jgi:hypothetical protein
VCPAAEQVVEGNDPYEVMMLGNYPEESIKHSEHSESMKSRILV